MYVKFSGKGLNTVPMDQRKKKEVDGVGDIRI
jgi:hypothetical protein